MQLLQRGNAPLSPAVTLLTLHFSFLARGCFDALRNWTNEHSYVKAILAGRSSGEITDEEAAQKVLVEYFEKNPDHLPTSNGRRFFCIASYTDRAIIKFSIQENLYDLSTIFSPLRFFLDRNGGNEPKCTIRNVSLLNTDGFNPCGNIEIDFNCTPQAEAEIHASLNNILLAQAKANNTNKDILKGIDDLKNGQPWTSENSFVSFTFDNATRTHHVFTKHSKYVFMVTKALMDLGGRVHTVTTTTEGSPKTYKYKIVSKSKARTLESMSQTDSNHRKNAQRLVDASKRIVFFNKTGPPNETYLQHYQKEINDRISVYTGTTGNYIKDITCRQATKNGKTFGVYTIDLIHHEHVVFILGDDTHPPFCAEFAEAGYGNQRKPLPHTPDLIGKKGLWIKRTKDKSAYDDLRAKAQVFITNSKSGPVMRNLESALAAADKQANRTPGSKTKLNRNSKSNQPPRTPAADTRTEIEVEELGEGMKVDDRELKAEIEKIKQDVRNTAVLLLRLGRG